MGCVESTTKNRTAWKRNSGGVNADPNDDSANKSNTTKADSTISSTTTGNNTGNKGNNKKPGAGQNHDGQNQTGHDPHNQYIVKGVSVHFLRNDFLFEIHEAGLDPSAKIYDLEDLSQESHGLIRRKGEKTVCPRDGRMGAAYVDCIEGEDNVGPANLMLSYGWANTVDTITSTLYDHCISKNLNPKRTYVWICCLCNNQHRVAERKKMGIEVTFDEFQRIFYDRVISIGNVLCLMSPWDTPIYLTRCWCLFELFTAYESDHVNIVIAMPPNEKSKMVSALNDRDGIHTLFDVLHHTLVENATASEESDRVHILSIIENGPGFDNFNQKINALLRDWVNHSVMEIVEQEESKVQDIQQATQFGMLCTYVGNVLFRYKEMKQALILNQKAIAIHSMIYGRYHPYTAASMSNYGLILKENGDLEEAMETFENVKNIHERTLGPDHMNTAISLNNIALCLSEKGDYDKALDYFLKCIDIYQAQLGNHTSTAGVHSNCGYVLLKQGRIDEALCHFEKALSIRLVLFNENHPDVADSYHTLGLAWRQKGDMKKALEYHHQCLAIEEKILGPEHGSTVTTYDSIASILFDLKEYQESLEYCTKVYHIYSNKTNQHDRPTRNKIIVVKAIWNVGKTLRAIGDSSAALKELERGLELLQHDSATLQDSSEWIEKFQETIAQLRK